MDLARGATKAVEFTLPLLAACTWEPGLGWWPAGGVFEVAVGASSADVRLSARWKLQLASSPMPKGG